MHFSKTIGLAFAATTIAGSAYAADLPSRKVAPAYVAPAPVVSWTGFYIGLNAGVTFGGSNGVVVSSTPIFAYPTLSAFGISQFNNVTAQGNGVAPVGNRLGGLVGGQIGWNWQSGAFVAGIEADIQGVFGSGSTDPSVSLLNTTVVNSGSLGIIQASRKTDWLGTLRGRVGYLVTPSLLAYVTGGLAYGGVKSSAAIYSQSQFPVVGDVGPVGSGGAFSGTRLGWTVGAGGEWKFASNWSAKLEYLYYDLGSVTYSAGARTARELGGVLVAWTHASTASTRFNGHIVRAGLNYHFNWGSAPVVAKY